MTVGEFYDSIIGYILKFMGRNIVDQSVRVHIGNQLYDVKDIDTVIDMDTNKSNIVIHVDDK